MENLVHGYIFISEDLIAAKENLKEEEAGFITKFQIYVYNKNYLLTYLLSNKRQMKMYTNQHKSFKSF